MSEFYNEAIRLLAKRANAELMNSIDSFVQGFIMGRKYEREFNVNLHNSILKEMYSKSDIKFSDDNWWDKRITELEQELFSLKAKYVYNEEE